MLKKNQLEPLMGIKFTTDKLRIRRATNCLKSPLNLVWFLFVSSIHPDFQIKCGYKLDLSKDWEKPASQKMLNICLKTVFTLFQAFFRRTLKRKSLDFQCICTPEERALGTDAPRKTTCPKCRYERCTKLGMSKDGIRQLLLFY